MRTECLQTSHLGAFFSWNIRNIQWSVWLMSRWELVLSNPPFAPLIQTQLWLRGEGNGGGKPILPANRWTFGDSLCARANTHKVLHRHSGAQTNTSYKTLPISLRSLIRTDVIPAKCIKEDLSIPSDPLLTKAGGDGADSARIKERAV